jgi:translation initiation factor IF-1
MVKNTGGNKSKKMARKTVATISSQEVRRIAEPGEMYAAVTKMYSSTRCDVIGTDGKTRACTIRGKFLGRRRNGDGTMAPGAWVMIGFREWEVRGDGSKICDLLEVYTQNEKEKLKQLEGHNLAAIMSIGELAGTENEFTFSAFHQGEDDLRAPVMDDDDDDDDDMFGEAMFGEAKPKAIKAEPKAIKVEAKAVATLAAHMQKINIAKKESPNEQMDWLNINVNDI